jgi:uncharacterized protein (TIGR02996 family)
MAAPFESGDAPFPGYRELHQFSNTLRDRWTSSDANKEVIVDWYRFPNRFRAGDLHTLRRVQALSHPGILPILDIFLFDLNERGWWKPADIPAEMDPQRFVGCVVVTAEARKPLSRYQQSSRPVPPPIWAEPLEKVVAALDYLHSHPDGPFVYAELHPDTILELRSERLLLAPWFRLAVLQPSPLEAYSTGRPMYTAPEQFRGRHLPASDQFALAMILYELRTGFSAHARDANIVELMTAVVEGRLRFPLVGPAERAVLRRATAVEPAERYPTCQEFYTAFVDAMRSSDPYHEGFLKSLGEAPHDDSIRLAYADWLDEQQRPGGAFLRAEAELNALAKQDAAREQLFDQLLLMTVDLPRDWLATVSRADLTGCDVQFEFRCPKTWESLRPTDAPNVRYCSECNQSVHFVYELDELRELATKNLCAAIQPMGLVALGRVATELTPALPPPPRSFWSRLLGR